MNERKKVLIVEDTKMLRMSLEVILQETYEVAGAADGNEALEILREFTPDIILLDLMLPYPLDGFSLLRLLKSNPSTHMIPVIIISTLTGTANFALDRIDESYKNIFVMATGGLNIFAAILTTIGQFLKISELNEAHRVASFSWGKFYRSIKTELAKSKWANLNKEQWFELAPIFDKINNSQKNKLTIEEFEYFTSHLQKIIDQKETIHFHDDFFLQMLENLITHVNIKMNPKIFDNEDDQLAFEVNQRDLQMARNLIYFKERNSLNYFIKN